MIFLPRGLENILMASNFGQNLVLFWFEFGGLVGTLGDYSPIKIELLVLEY